MKKAVKIILVLFLVTVITIITGHAASHFLDPPALKLSFMDLQQPTAFFEGTIHQKREHLLALEKIKEKHNPRIIMYDENMHILLNYYISIDDTPYFKSPENIKFTILTITGESIDSYITIKNEFILKEALSELTKINDDYHNIILAKGNVNEMFIKIANEYYDILPINIRYRLVEDGWKIYITDTDIGKLFNIHKIGPIAAVTLYEEKMILIKNKSKAIKESVLHEIGHAVDYTGKYSNTAQFQEIYLLEKDKMQGDIIEYATSTKEEYFAEMFQHFILGVKEDTPKTHEYIKKIINEF